MIDNIQVLKGYATDLECVKNYTFTFTDKMNVLFGPNGCGKSSLLKIMKAYCGIRQGGWSQISEELSFSASRADQFPHAYNIFSPGNCLANVGWDGTPSFFNEGDVKVDGLSWFFSNEKMSEDGISTGDDHMDTMALKPSSGQYRLQKINKILNVIESPPVLYGSTPEGNYIKTLPKNGKVTLLFDEPERALSLPKQMELFRLLEGLSDNYQIIIATHSPFVLFNLGAKIFDMEENYSTKCIEIFQTCVKDYLTGKLESTV